MSPTMALRSRQIRQGSRTVGVQPKENSLDGADLTFVNPTDAWMLLRMSASGTTVVAELHGAPTGYRVEIDDPEISDRVSAEETVEQVDPSLPSGTKIEVLPAQDGMTVVLVRRVADADGNEIASDRSRAGAADRSSCAAAPRCGILGWALSPPT